MTTRDPSFPVAILAGGLATRLRPLTETIPKVLLEVAGRPFLEYQLASLKEQGVREIVLCVGYLGDRIEDQFGDGSKYGVSITYSYDGPILLGTGGALRVALPLLGDAFFTLYGDSYLNVDFRAVADAFIRSSRSALMTVYRNSNLYDISNVEFASGQIVAYDKKNLTPAMNHIDYGLSICKASVFTGYQSQPVLDLSQVMTDLAIHGDLAGYEAVNRFYEIGSHAGLSELESYLAV